MSKGDFLRKKTDRKLCMILAVIILSVILVMLGMLTAKGRQKNSRQEKIAEEEQEMERRETYLALDDADKQTAGLYAKLYEMTAEEVAVIRKETGDWDETGKRLDEMFFTIPENTKYQMEQEGYSLGDMKKAEELSARTGRKAMELLLAKGKASEKKDWSDIVKDSEILTTEEQLGLSKEQIQQLKDRSVKKKERVEVALLLLNKTCTFDEVLKSLDEGKTLDEIK